MLPSVAPTLLRSRVRPAPRLTAARFPIAINAPVARSHQLDLLSPGTFCARKRGACRACQWGFFSEQRQPRALVRDRPICSFLNVYSGSQISEVERFNARHDSPTVCRGRSRFCALKVVKFAGAVTVAGPIIISPILSGRTHDLRLIRPHSRAADSTSVSSTAFRSEGSIGLMTLSTIGGRGLRLHSDFASDSSCAPRR